MSNYTKELDNGTTVIYGFNVREGYFLKVYTPFDNSKLEIMNMSTKLTSVSNEMLIELMTLYNLPESQIEQVALNNPIT